MEVGGFMTDNGHMGAIQALVWDRCDIKNMWGRIPSERNACWEFDERRNSGTRDKGNKHRKLVVQRQQEFETERRVCGSEEAREASCWRHVFMLLLASLLQRVHNQDDCFTSHEQQRGGVGGVGGSVCDGVLSPGTHIPGNVARRQVPIVFRFRGDGREEQRTHPHTAASSCLSSLSLSFS
ncbi:unnamed protein product [Pleuronectes platessa]|uniref:Uncharacterized protein n=1 Tax=Pleuronectes platessa TaxID=8262 RepID=A0A9N7YCE9_PLEPL|nr:unnamed protein product [Pleuronectes platessa]